MHQLLLTIAVGQTFFAALILMLGKKQGRSRSAAILGAFIFVYGVSFFQELEFVGQLNRSIPVLVPITFIFYFLIGPTFYFYIKDLTKTKNEALVQSWPLHVVPIVLGVGLMSAWVLMSEDARQAAISTEFWPVDRPLTMGSASIFLAQVVSHIQIFCYLMGSLKLLYDHLSRVRDLFSNLEDKTLGWARLAIFALIAIWFTDLVTDIGYVFGWFGQMGEVIFTAGELALFYFVTVFGLRQPEIIVHEESDRVLTSDDHDQTVGGFAGTEPLKSGLREVRSKYAKSALDDEQMTRIAEKLERAMEAEKLFTNSTLTLADLSQSIRTPQNYVSQTLNQRMGLKFYDYIAKHRVDAAKLMLAEPGNQDTVLSIALSVGFNSKSTFNAAFKRFVGATPSQFRADPKLYA